MQAEMPFHLVEQRRGVGNIVPILVVYKHIVPEILRMHPLRRPQISLARARV